MALFNHATKELTAKIVYYGPGLCGKTTNLKILHQRLERGAGKLLSLSTAQDRTIYFDLLPIELGNIKGYTVRFQVCTVPGQVFYNETRRIVLRGVDGLVFVVDSQWSMLSHNLESFQNLRENLADEKIPLESLPVVIQYNKRDLPSALSVEALQESLGFQSYPYVEAVASEGMGVLETFKLASKLTFVDLLRRLQRGWQPPAEADAQSAEFLASSAPGVQSFAGPAITISAPAPEPEIAPAAAPVLAMARPTAGAEAPAEEPQERVSPPAARPASTFEARPLAGIAGADRGRAAPPTTSGERTRPSRPESTSPVRPLDDKLNAVLAEARRAAAGRISGTFKRGEAAPSDGSTADPKRLEALEKALEAEQDERRRLATALEAERDERRHLAAALEAERDERRRLATALEAERDERQRLATALEADRNERQHLATALETERAAHDLAGQKADEALGALRAGTASFEARVNEAHEALDALRRELADARAATEASTSALRTEAEENRRGLADALAAERAVRESTEKAAREAAELLAVRVAALGEDLAAAKGVAEASHASATAAGERAHRLVEALRAALRDLSS
jgi:signal recognition particle receptor subunit beta